MQPLTLKYRPATFSDVTGQGPVRVVLTQMIRTGQIPPAMLFHGSWGSGKTSLARIFAAALNCEEDDPAARPCGGCVTCRATASGQSTDVTEIDAASAGLVEDVRSLRETARFAPHGRYRVILIDEAHNLTIKGFQALLKILEEPPESVLFLLVTTSLDSIPDTIASRCFSLEFRRLTDAQISARLLHIASSEEIPVSPELASAIAARSQGALRDAVMDLDLCALVKVTTPEGLVKLMGDTDVAVRFVTALARGDQASALELERQALEVLPSAAEFVSRVVSCLRRVLVLASLPEGAQAPLAPPATAAEVSLGREVLPARLVAAMRVVWDFYSRIAPATDAYTSMDLISVMLSEALAGSGVRSSAPRASAPLGESSPSNTSVQQQAMSVEQILAAAASHDLSEGATPQGR